MNIGPIVVPQNCEIKQTRRPFEARATNGLSRPEEQASKDAAIISYAATGWAIVGLVRGAPLVTIP
ncbi:MAG: hypothetical protein EXS05_13840 [Planctomycetaceae bacterium]|nr:hypothetical protein [Planctomycetaceae bacterium]